MLTEYLSKSQERKQLRQKSKKKENWLLWNAIKCFSSIISFIYLIWDFKEGH